MGPSRPQFPETPTCQWSRTTGVIGQHDPPHLALGFFVMQVEVVLHHLRLLVPQPTHHHLQATPRLAHSEQKK